ncbi:ubiquitin-conjugating enzyme E2 G1 isoform X3 [Cyanistes caeruleus]|uniref:ubiquitin-conjugating enzyme E2 G1 isoform X3 n=1 Tax=Cyanistes caeruleus TaxID=156563 RepID=UPI000CDB65A0|nr:ubiquitin-conjugating enzyme E2 G1 isoform X3 [Cyanistes caeruleus]
MRLHVCAATLKGKRAGSAPFLPPPLAHVRCILCLLSRDTGIYSRESGGLHGTVGESELNKNPVEGFSAGLIDDNDLYRWEVLIIGPPDTLYEGGVFKAHLTFPKDYPLRPPKMKFITEIWHPNVDKNGDVCISILHEPGEDKYGYEKPEERWLPIHTVETIMISVISMLADPNGDSPANVDAAVSN